MSDLIKWKPKKILVADDHIPTRRLFSKVLAAQNYVTIHATNGEEAYAKALFEQPDLILMDVNMPVMDGYEALAKLKEDPNTYPIKVLMLTAVDRPLERRLAREMGASGYLVKPVPIDELERDIRSVMTAAA